MNDADYKTSCSTCSGRFADPPRFVAKAKRVSIAPRPRADAPLHCAKCGKHNERDAIICTSCGTHLWIKCSRCSAKNARTASRCTKCHQQMRALSFVLPRWNRRFGDRNKKHILRALGWLLLVGVAAWLVYHSLPEPAEPPENTAAPHH